MRVYSFVSKESGPYGANSINITSVHAFNKYNMSHSNEKHNIDTDGDKRSTV